MTSSSPASWDRIVVRFGEIALKQGNRRRFIRLLARNISRVLAPWDGKVQDEHDLLWVDLAPEHVEQALDLIARMPGVQRVEPVRFLSRDPDEIGRACLDYYREQNRPGASYGVKARRTDKTFPMKAPELQAHVGEIIGEATQAPVNLSHPDIPVVLRVIPGNVMLIGSSRRGPGGLPPDDRRIEVLTLFSGGLDSPVAAWHLMQRGCPSDYVHLHVYPTPEQAFDTKIPKLLEALLAPQGMFGTLYLMPYHPFQMALLSARVPPPLELILFRRCLFRAASRLGRKQQYKALATGDNLSQVASQTLGNLMALEGAAELPVLRPVLAHDKHDIIAKAEEIGTFQLSVEPYKDCCSLTAKRPDTNPRFEHVLEVEETLPVEDITREILDGTAAWKYKGGEWSPRTLR